MYFPSTVRSGMEATIPSRIVVVVLALFIVGVTPAGGQARDAESITYEREVFEYSRNGRPDPFRSLVRDDDLGVRIEDLELRGIVYHSDPSQSVAVLTQRDSDRRIHARIGERVGSVRIVAIRSETVDVVVEELGVARRETLRMERSPTGEGAR
jgi:hypothetical protein